jgi:DNA end-binding protein Ku
VAIPVRIHTATHSENVSFNLLHNECGSRVRNQHYCPVCEVVVEREDLVRGFQHAKDQYVPNQHELLLAAAYKLGDCNAPALGNGISEQSVRLGFL